MKTIENSNTIFNDLFDFSPIPTGVFALDGRVLFANRTFFNMLGYEDMAHPGESLTLASVFKCSPDADELIRLVQERKVIRRKEALIATAEGYQFNGLVSARYLDYLKEPALEVSFVDISRQQQKYVELENENARLASFLENLTLGLFLVDNAGKLTKINLALENLLEITKEDWVSCSYRDLFALILSKTAEADIVQRWLSDAAKRVLESPSVEFTLQNEKPYQIELTFFPVWGSEGQSIGWGGLLQDITDLREQTAWKLELLSVLSHDIRTPLATLKGHATALLANYRHWSDDMVSEFLETIDRGVDDLVHQVDRNLSLTRVESGRLGLRPETVDVRGVIQQAIERSAGVIKDRQVELLLPENLPKIHVDPARTEEVFMNLLENAVRFNPSDKPLRIRAQQEETWLQLAVVDEGPGVAAENRKVIFEKFVSAGDEKEGTGLGLYICKKIVESQGGKIWVESPPKDLPQGAAFIFTVPTAPEEIQTKTEKAGMLAKRDLLVERKQDLNATVLVVEDEPDLQALFHTILTQAGYQVQSAPDGPTALSILQTESMDLVLLDWVLPGMSGLSVCRNLRRWSSVPVIIVTSKTSQEDLVTALDAGADDYVTKPFSGDELLARIRAHMRKEDEQPTEAGRDQFRLENLLIDFDSREVWVSSDRLDLTPTEFDLLAYLIRNRRQVLTYEQLIDHLWGLSGEGTRHSLFVHISRLRAKIEENPKEPRFIQTRWGVGYSFVSS